MCASETKQRHDGSWTFPSQASEIRSILRRRRSVDRRTRRESDDAYRGRIFPDADRSMRIGSGSTEKYRGIQSYRDLHRDLWREASGDGRSHRLWTTSKRLSSCTISLIRRENTSWEIRNASLDASQPRKGRSRRGGRRQRVHQRRRTSNGPLHVWERFASTTVRTVPPFRPQPNSERVSLTTRTVRFGSDIVHNRLGLAADPFHCRLKTLLVLCPSLPLFLLPPSSRSLCFAYVEGPPAKEGFWNPFCDRHHHVRATSKQHHCDAYEGIEGSCDVRRWRKQGLPNRCVVGADLDASDRHVARRKEADLSCGSAWTCLWSCIHETMELGS